MSTFYIQAILTASLGGVLFGYDLGVIAGALPPLSAYFHLTPSQEEWIVSLLYFGGGVGAASGGFLCDWCGRKFAILFTDVMFGLGAFLLYNAETLESVMIGRFVVGWAVAVSGIADVAYLHEISSVWGGEEEAREVDGGVREPDRTDSTVEVPTEPNCEDGVRRNKQNHNTVGRGSVVSVNEACISLGFLLAYGVAYALRDQYQVEASGVDEEASDSWRLMFALGGFLAAFQFFGMLFMPESPVWLHGKGRIQEAISARNKIRGTENTTGNIDIGIGHSGISDSSIDNNGFEMNDSPTSTNSRESSSRLEQSPSSFAAEEQILTPVRSSRVIDGFLYMTVKIISAPSQIQTQYRRMVDEIFAPYKRQCAIAFFLAASQQFCGHPSVLNFSAELFTMLRQSGDQYAGTDASSGNGQEDMAATKLTVGIGLLKFLTTCIVIMCIEKGGRRSWLLARISCILISLTFLCIAFIHCDDEDIGNSSGSLHQHPSSSLMNGLGIIGIYGVAIGYAASFGPLTWLITSELFPSPIRGRALGFATIITYMAAGLVSRTFLSIQKGIGLAGCFALYWMATFFALLFVLLGIPDTGGDKSPEEIERELDDMRIWAGRRHFRRCPSLLRRRLSRSGDRPSTSSWTSVGSHSAKSYATCEPPDPPLDVSDTSTSSPKIASAHSVLTPRRSISITTKEIT